MRREMAIRIIYSGILVLIVAVLAAAAILPHDRDGWWGGTYRVIREAEVTEPGKEAENRSFPIMGSGDETITVRWKLPSKIESGDVMAINSAWKKLSLTWNGKSEIFDWSGSGIRDVRWTVVELSGEDAGSTVTASIIPGKSLSAGYMSEVLAGDQTALCYRLFRMSLPHIGAGICGLVSGALIMVLSLRMNRNRKTLRYRYIAIGLMLAGILLVCENRFGRAVRITRDFAAAFNAPGIWLMIAAYLLYVREMLEGDSKTAFTALCGGYAAAAVSGTIQQAAGIPGLNVSCQSVMTPVILIPILLVPAVLMTRRLKRAAGQSVVWRSDRGEMIRTGRNLSRETAADLRVALVGTAVCAFAILMDLTAFLRTGVQDYMGGECIALLFLSVVAALRFVRYMILDEMEREEAGRRFEESGRFIETMSDAIREPVDEILMHNEKIYALSRAGGVKNYTRQIQSACDVLLSVIGNIRSFSELESGQAAPRPEPYDLFELIGECASLVGVMAENKGLHLKAVCAPELPAVMTGDREWIRMILTNLLTNAVKYTIVGSVQLEVTAASKEENGRVLVRFAVEDTGIGISREDQERIFETFRRTRDTNRPGLEGAGLGLALTRRLIELQNGSLWLDSAPGKGSRFEVELEQGSQPGEKRIGKNGVWRPADAPKKNDEIIRSLAPFVNTREGLGYCMDDPDLYLEMIRDYADSDRCTLLQEAYNKEEWKSYRVSVHALKSTSRMIGADGIAQLARALEKAAENGDAETICDGHGVLMEKTEALRAHLAAALSENMTAEETNHEDSDL
jgi:signal transduction histidine kinase/HPt (histidine-containing phosphotransfer) domain-containing protein